MKMKTLGLLCLALSFGCAPKQEKEKAQPLLPQSLIVTYYGNPLSKKMGILGALPPKEMTQRLAQLAKSWQNASPLNHVKPGLELIAVIASDRPGPQKLYRTRMPKGLITQVIGWARQYGWLTILDVQIGHSTVKSEIEWLKPFLEAPDVHLALDPEFQMPKNIRPGAQIGRSDAEDVNTAIILLSRIIKDHHLPPKLLLVHRFTDGMLRRQTRIRLSSNVQVVMVMDGFGSQQLKTAIYHREITLKPVAFSGIKLFYKNDKPLMSPKQVLDLKPTPHVIIYQ